MWLKTVAAAAALAACVVGGVPGLAAADPTTPVDPTTQADPTTPDVPIAPTPPADTAAPTASGTPAESTAPTGSATPPTPKTSIDADGTYAVGTDIVPGVYSTAGPVDNGTCFWKRSGNPDGATIDNALTKKPQTVEIAPTDQSFKTNGCQPWQLTDGAVPPASQGMSPALAGVQLKLYMAQLNARAAASGQPPSP
ncbi:MAG: hypothetical protein QOI01_2560 [Mycobacterium sp.]|jgi:hypothetical protein|nr:hypothetical protein [Mycobacterium sp.]